MLRLRKYAVAVIIVMALAGCSTTATFKEVSYKSLALSRINYDTGMKIVSGLQSQGIIDKAQRANINVAGNVYMQSHNLAVESLLAYEKTNLSEDKAKVSTLLEQVKLAYPTFAKLINSFKAGTIPEEFGK